MFAQLLKDPPPSYAFELSEAGIAFAKRAAAAENGFQPFDQPVLSVSPVHDNIQNPEALQAHINAIVPPNGKRKRRIALVLPDYSARVAVLDFDAFPTNADEQLALVRFRMKKSVPFDIESAIVSYYAQPKNAVTGKIEVVVAIMAREIVARYEAPFRSAGMHPGYVTTSSLAMLNLVEPGGLTLLAKLSGRTLSVMVLDGSTLKLARCIEMADTSREEIEGVLHPTLAFVEDELSATPARVLLCGFGHAGDDLVREWQAQLGAAVEPIRSRTGMPGQNNAGLLGYLESVQG